MLVCVRTTSPATCLPDVAAATATCAASAAAALLLQPHTLPSPLSLCDASCHCQGRADIFRFPKTAHICYWWLASASADHAATVQAPITKTAGLPTVTATCNTWRCWMHASTTIELNHISCMCNALCQVVVLVCLPPRVERHCLRHNYRALAHARANVYAPARLSVPMLAATPPRWGDKVGSRTLHPSWLHAITGCSLTLEVNGNICMFAELVTCVPFLLPDEHSNMFLACTGES